MRHPASVLPSPPLIRQRRLPCCSQGCGAALIVLSLFAAGLVGLHRIFPQRVHVIPRHDVWSVGTFRVELQGSRPVVSPAPGVVNPTFAAADTGDPTALFAADPFLVREAGTYFLFTEVLRIRDGREQGCIGVATSPDGLQWRYLGVALDEPFHLSYPCVLKWRGRWYMVPEEGDDNCVRLYTTDRFPLGWRRTKTLLSGKTFRDSTLFEWQGRWWLFTTADDERLEAYYAASPEGPWHSHARNPIVTSAREITRPAGPPLQESGHLIRLAQDCSPTYGNAVRALDITRLTPEAYEEHELAASPLLQDSGSGWNAAGMHQLCAVPLDGGRWIAVADGKRETGIAAFRIGPLRLDIPGALAPWLDKLAP